VRLLSVLTSDVWLEVAIMFIFGNLKPRSDVAAQLAQTKGYFERTLTLKHGHLLLIGGEEFRRALCGLEVVAALTLTNLC